MDMALPVSLDLDLLRSFVAIAEEKSFTRAADRVGRTQSAVSLQMQRLETLIEQTLLDRGKGGSVELAPAGQYLLTRAREILAMNDDIVKSLRRTEVHGRVRLGIASEFAPHLVSSILQAFALRAPDVEVEMVQTVSCALAVKLKAGELDVVILEQGLEPRQWPAETIRRERLRWVTSDVHGQHKADVLPVTVSPNECEWRPPWLTECLWSGMTMRTLEQSGLRHRIAARSGTTSGQLALVAAGVAVAAMIESTALPAGLSFLPDGILPDLPEISFLMMKAREPRQPMSDRLMDDIRAIVSADALTEAPLRPTAMPS